MRQQKNRWSLIVIGLILIVGGLFLIALTLGLVTDVGPELGALAGQWIVALGGLIAVLVGILIFSAGFKTKGLVQAITQHSELGEIRVSFMAIENMVLKASRKIKGIKETKTFITSTEQGLVIYLKIKTLPDLKIPELVAELQDTVKSYVEEISGTAVAEVKVLVENMIIDQQPKK